MFSPLARVPCSCFRLPLIEVTMPSRVGVAARATLGPQEGMIQFGGCTRCGGRSLDFVPCWPALLTQGRRRTAPDRLVGLVRVPELLLRFVPGAPEVRRPVVHPATALRDPCTHHCSTHLVPAHAAASMHHSGSVGLASLLTSHMDSAHGKRDRQFLACSRRVHPLFATRRRAIQGSRSSSSSSSSSLAMRSSHLSSFTTSTSLLAAQVI